MCGALRRQWLWKVYIIKIYEDNAYGRLTDERYDMLSQTYEAEQKQLEAEAITLQQEIEVQERQWMHRTSPAASRYSTSRSSTMGWDLSL